MKWNPRKFLIFSLGIMVILVGTGLMVSGGYIIWLNGVLNDGQGFYSSTREMRIRTTSHAVIFNPEKTDLNKSWPFNYNDWDNLRVRVNAGENFLIGLAPEEKLKSYLSEVNYDEITYYSLYPVEVKYENYSGSYVPPKPEDQSFWIEKYHDSLDFDLKLSRPEEGDFLVFMNKDGSSGLNFDIKLGISNGQLLYAGIGMVVGGLLVMVVGVGIVTVSRIRI